jgi:leader peptidase (prepilin peptidase)/N-methyltransferase
LRVIFAADVPTWLLRLFAFVFGSLWGSFFNVAIYRWPRGMSVVSPPSHCPSCGAPVRWYLNVPILGYALLGGRARCCGTKLTPRYVWVELLTAVLFLAVAERVFVRAEPGTLFYPALIEMALYWVFVGGLIIATFVDLEWMEIPDEVSLPGAALALATVGLRSTPGAVEAAVGAGVGFLVVQLGFVWLYEHLTGRRGMGEGDAKLLMMIGAFLGWESVLFCLVAGSAQGLLVAGFGMATGMSLIPERPDGIDPHEAAGLNDPATTPSAEDESPRSSEGNDVSGQQESEQDAPGPPMMVFGPMLALAALEYFFFGEIALGWFLGMFE